ncbi:unnamed protein product [Leptidea sinapis]|uniref:Uncharacterized protein n=2 Tax=Leptidea sinapis TaxID=189913 RepID=A0A5E4QBL3_9NEOP|nr:unnamed protein product [Leptidea sinapis]
MNTTKIFVYVVLSFASVFAMTRQQLKNSGKLMKKSCIPKNDVTEEQVGQIEQGKFIEERNVMCYIACIYTMTQVVKNNKLNYDAVIKQVDTMFPVDMRDAVKAAAANCKDVRSTRIYVKHHIGRPNMTRQQLKNAAKLVKKNCMAKNNVTEDLIGDIEKGKFIQQRAVMCYIACVYQTTQIIKNNKISYEASVKQVNMNYPAEMKDAMLVSIENCKSIPKKYKDICESAYWTARCIYEDNPGNFLFA